MGSRARMGADAEGVGWGHVQKQAKAMLVSLTRARQNERT